AQPARIDDISRMSDEADGARQGEWKNVRAPQTRPDLLELGHAFGVRNAGKIAGVDRADRSADDEIRPYAEGQQDAQHADLDRAEAASSGKDKCCFFPDPSHRRKSL